MHIYWDLNYLPILCNSVQCPKGNPKFRDITWNWAETVYVLSLNFGLSFWECAWVTLGLTMMVETLRSSECPPSPIHCSVYRQQQKTAKNHCQSCWRERRELASKSKLLWVLLKRERELTIKSKSLSEMLKGEERLSYQIKIVLRVVKGRGESKLSNKNCYDSCWRERRE